MRRIISTPTSAPVSEMTAPPPISEISIDGLLGDGLVALHREIKNLLIASAKGKLDAADARDLRDHIKLLFEIREREKSLLTNISTEDLEKLLKAKNDNQAGPG